METERVRPQRHIATRLYALARLAKARKNDDDAEELYEWGRKAEEAIKTLGEAQKVLDRAQGKK